MMMARLSNAVVLFMTTFIICSCSKLNGAKDPILDISEIKSAPEDDFSPIVVGEELHLACETSVNQGIFITDLQGHWGTGWMLKPHANEVFESPKFLSISGNAWKIAFISHTESGDQLTVGENTPQRNIRRSSIGTLPKNRPALAKIYSALGLPSPAYVLPTQFHFLTAQEDSYEWRNILNPTSLIANWELNPEQYINPRLGIGEIYFDVLTGEEIRQSIVRFDANYSIKAKEALPEPLLEGTQVHQVGLRLFDDDLYVWLEWTNGKGLLRFMDRHSRKTSAVEIPTSVLISPHYEIYRSQRDGLVFSFSSKTEVQVFSLDFGKLKVLASLAFSEENQKSIAQKGPDFWPATFATDKNEHNLFLTLPDADGQTRLYLVNKKDAIQRASAVPCHNPTFF